MRIGALDGGLFVLDHRNISKIATYRSSWPFVDPAGSETMPGAVTALLEDREGDLWVGGMEGVEQLRDSAFLSYRSPRSGVEDNGPIYVDAEGRTWFPPSDGGLFWLSGAQVTRVNIPELNDDVVCSIAGGPAKCGWADNAEG